MKEKVIPNGDASGPSRSSVVDLETVFFMDLMNLVHHCAVTRYDSGAPREPGWLTVKTLGSIWTVSIKDPDSCLSVAAVGVTLDDALTTANTLAGADNAPWEPDRFLEKRPGRKKK